MSEPIRKKINQLASAPTPQNTPASLTGSYLKNNPLMVPSTIDEEAEIKKNLSNNPAFLSMIQGKLGTLVGRDSGYIDSLSPKVKARIYSLKAVQKDQLKLEDEFQKELLELEKKYLKKYAPIYEHRKQIITGEVEPTEEEIATGKQIEKELGAEDDEEENKAEEGEQEEKEDDSEVEGIPDFWLTALENLTYVSQTITERDQEVLSYLTNIRMEYLTQPGFKLIFEFKQNPFFENKSLTKYYYYQEELGYSGDYIYDHAEGEAIKWVSAKQNVTVQIERRRQRNKQTQQTRTIEKATPVESFFNFFDPPKAPGEEAEEEEEEEELEELEARLALDYQLGEEIKDKLIPRAIDWFTGSAVDFEGGEEEEFDEAEFDEEDEGDEDEDDEEEGDEDDEDDEDDEGEEDEGKGKQPPECKQT